MTTIPEKCRETEPVIPSRCPEPDIFLKDARVGMLQAYTLYGKLNTDALNIGFLK